jgi:hypothetical protein
MFTDDVLTIIAKIPCLLAQAILSSFQKEKGHSMGLMNL